jgi:hypothetical protein
LHLKPGTFDREELTRTNKARFEEADQVLHLNGAVIRHDLLADVLLHRILFCNDIGIGGRFIHFGIKDMWRVSKAPVRGHQEVVEGLAHALWIGDHVVEIEGEAAVQEE